MVATSSNPCFPKIGWWFSIPNRNGSHPPSSALFYPWFWLQIGPRFWRAVWVILNWTFSSWCLWQRYRGSTCGGGCGNQQRPDILQMLPTQILLLHGFTKKNGGLTESRRFYQQNWRFTKKTTWSSNDCRFCICLCELQRPHAVVVPNGFSCLMMNRRKWGSVLWLAAS